MGGMLGSLGIGANANNPMLGGSGANFAPQSAPILGLTNADQLSTANTGSNNALAQQQAFLNSVNAQNGLGNQTQNYNQLQGVINGTGPNPAQAMLNQATGANVSNQSALMAGQRGAAANPALIARQAAQQGANTQQQAVGQGATMQANQSLGALGQAGNIANTQAGQQAAAVGANTAANQQQQSNLINAGSQMNSANVANTGNMNQVSGTLANTVAGNQAKMGGGLLNGVSGLLSTLLAQGGMVGYADGGPVNTNQVAPASTGSYVGKILGGMAPSGANDPLQQNYNSFGNSVGNLVGKGIMGAGNAITSAAYGNQLMAKGGAVPALVSPGERYLSPGEVAKVAKGEKSPMKAGEKIEGKPKVGGARNDYRNDTKRKTLQVGGIVLPRTVTQSKDRDAKSKKFVGAVLAKKSFHRL